MRLALPMLLAAVSALLAAAAPTPELSLGSNEGILPELEKRSEGLLSELEKRIVYNPQIVYPKETTVWVAGGTHRVEWLTADMPEAARNFTGVLKLGYLNDDSEEDPNEHLYTTLAEDFPLSKGIVRFELPSGLPSRDNYIVVLFGDSGNASPEFTIISPSLKATASAAA